MSHPKLDQSSLKEHEDVYNHFPDVVFLAEAENDPFEPIHVITTQQYYKEKAYDEAWEIATTTEEVYVIGDRIFREKYSNGQEFIEIKSDRVIIVIKAETITDTVINRALYYLTSIDDFVPGLIYDLS